MRSDNDSDQGRVEEALEQLWDRLPAPDDDLRTLADAASSQPRQARSPGWHRVTILRWRIRLGWVTTVVAVAVALLVGSGLGFGLGSSVTPSGSAGTNFAGFGFIPARGWTVVQSGLVGPAESGTAVAANVRLRPGDELRASTSATLESLPPNGIVVVATFTTRGDPGEDFSFEVQQLPLQIEDATRIPPAVEAMAFATRLASYGLRAGVGGYNVDARIYFGTSPPSPEMLASAERQLSRLVVSSERVTIFARPSLGRGGQAVTVFGSVDNGKTGEEVTVQARDCGEQVFRAVAGGTTRDGGGWSTEFTPWTTTTLRAVWNETASAQITIRQRIYVDLRKEWRATGPARKFEVWIVAKNQFWRRKVLFQRFNRRLGTWATVKSVLLTDTGSNDPTGQTPSAGTTWSRAEFTASLPKGTSVRAVFPQSQVGRCYLAGVSNSLRT